MKITKEQIKLLYDKYNQQYFNGILKDCKISVGKIIHFGTYVFKKDKDGKIEGKIWITNDVDWTEDTLKDVLIHEMIHHYVVSIDGCQGIDGFSWYGLFGHGKHFRKQIKRLKKEYNLKIHIHSPHLYHKNEKIPTTIFGKLLRYVNYEIS